MSVDGVREKRGRRDVVHASTSNSAVSFSFFLSLSYLSVSITSVAPMKDLTTKIQTYDEAHCCSTLQGKIHYKCTRRQRLKLPQESVTHTRAS